MRTITMLAAAFLLCAPALPAGDHPSPLLTGNPRVDFFGTGSAGPLAADPARPVFPQDDAPEQEGAKSPWLAGAMSLIIPGSGEAYAGSYLKGAIFLAAEVTVWGFAYAYDKKGDDQTVEYKAYANAHWNVNDYIRWTLANLGELNGTLVPPPGGYEGLIYPDGVPTTVDPGYYPPFNAVDWVELNAMERAVASGSNGYTHTLPYYGEQQYYELIGKYEQFSRGWDDSQIPEPPGTVNPVRSTSARFFEYAKMRARANDQYDVASTFVNVAVVNHVLSALDAYWSVTRLNKSLHASVRVKMQPSVLGSVPVTTANFRYDF